MKRPGAGLTSRRGLPQLVAKPNDHPKWISERHGGVRGRLIFRLSHNSSLCLTHALTRPRWKKHHYSARAPPLEGEAVHLTCPTQHRRRQ
jgi:hypothetical protein